MNVLVTIPKARFSSWKECRYYLGMIDGEQGGFHLVNTMHLPNKTNIGDLCFIVYAGFVRGYFHIVDIAPTESYRHLHRIGKRRKTQSLILANWRDYKHTEQTGFMGWRYTELHV